MNYRCYCLSLSLCSCLLPMCAHVYPRTNKCPKHNAQPNLYSTVINREIGLIRGLRYTSPLSSRLESGSTLIVQKRGRLNNINPRKISSVWAQRKLRVQPERNGETHAGMAMDREPRGLLSSNVNSFTSSFYTFPQPSVALICTRSPVGMTGGNNSSENIYLLRVPCGVGALKCPGGRAGCSPSEMGK